MSLPHSNILTEESSKILHKIAPRWMYVLDNAETFKELVGDGRKVMDDYLSLSIFECCIVGEINCFNSKYAETQDEMSSYSRSLYGLADVIARLEKRNSSMAIELAEVFFEMLNQMVRYLQDNHANLIKAKSKEYANITKQLQEVVRTNPIADLDECTIHFESHEEQAKAFNFLIHSKIGFKGIDRDTIRVKQDVCDQLDGNNIQYQKSY